MYVIAGTANTVF